MRTASFMLVTMLFQTLYILVDLYWVGRLGKEAVAGVGVAGNLQFVVLAVDPDAGRRHDDAGGACGRAEGPRARRAGVQPVADACRCWSASCSCVASMVLRTRYATLHERRPGDGGCRRRLSVLVPAGAGAAVRASSRWRSALRGAGNFKPGMVVQTATVIINIVLAPVLIFGWGTGRPLGVAGAALATLHRRARRRRVAGGACSCHGRPTCGSSRRTAAAPRDVGIAAEDRPAGRRRVRADGGQPVHRLRHHPAVRRRRRRPVTASACACCRRRSCRSWRWRSPRRRSPGRTSAPGSADRVKAVFRMAAGDGGRRDGGVGARLLLCARRRSIARLLGGPGRSSRSAATICGSSRGASSRPAWSSSPRACSRRWATRCRRSSRRSAACWSSRYRRSCCRRWTGFHLHWIWYLSVAAVLLQLMAIWWLLQREFATKLGQPRRATGIEPVAAAVDML